MYRAGFRCIQNDCSYECVVSNGVHTAFERMKPEQCQICGADIVEVDP